MAMKTISIMLGLATIVGSGCAAELGEGEETAPEAADLTSQASPSSFSIPALARADETARAIDRSLVLDSSAGEAPAAKIAAPGETITVSGRVLQITGASVAFLKVFILGQDAETLTDENGNFTIPNVTTPYDVVVAFGNGTTTHAVLYKGLRRPDPRLVALVDPEFFAVIGGTLSGGAGFPQPPLHFAFVQIGSDRGGMGVSQVFSPFGAFADSAQWGFARSTTAHLTAIQFGVDVDARRLNFTGAATAQFPISDGDVLMESVPLLPVKTARISGTYTHPAGYSVLAVGSLLSNPLISCPSPCPSPCPIRLPVEPSTSMATMRSRSSRPASYLASSTSRSRLATSGTAAHSRWPPRRRRASRGRRRS